MKTKTKIEDRFWMPSKKFTAIEAAVLLAVTSVQTLAAPGDVDPSFDPGSTINGEIMAMAVQSDGRIIIGGEFTTLHDAVCSRIARLNVDGTADHSFLGRVAKENDYGYVQAIALQADGKIVIGGWFNLVNGSARTNLARLNADGSLDPTFLNGLDGVAGVVRHVASQADGKILIAGWFSSVNGAARTNFVRLNSNGSLDETFDVVLVNEPDHPDPAPGKVEGLAVQADGKILIGGYFTSINGTARTNLARLNPDGTVDASFAPDLQWQDEGEHFLGDAQCFLVQGDHRIVVGGWFNSVNGLARTNIVRLNPDGSVDESFECPLGTTEGVTEEMQLRDDGRIAAIGSFTPDGIKWMSVVLLETNGTLVPQFQAPQVDGDAAVLGLSAGGKILVGMRVISIRNPIRSPLARLNDDGSLDNSFDSGQPTGPNSALSCVALAEDGRILIGGYSLSSVNGQLRAGVARLNRDGSLDGTFAPSVRSSDPDSSGTYCLAVQPDGNILLGGWFNSVNGATRNGIARIHADGSLDHAFLEGLSGVEGGMFVSASVYAVAIQTNGQILIGGNFSLVNGQSRIGLARLNSDGTLDAGFDAQLGGVVSSLAIQPDGKMLVPWGNSLRRYNPDGTTDGPILWSSGAIWCLVVQEDGKIVVGGQFDSLGGQPRRGLARVNPDLTVDDTFLGEVSGEYVNIRRLAQEADGKLLMAGNFTAVNGVARANLARLFPDGSLDTSFVADLPPYTVPAIVIQPDTKILLGGSFTAVNGLPRAYLVRLLGAYQPLALVRTPPSQTCEAGNPLNLGLKAAGYPPPAIQWFCNGAALTDCTNATLAFSNAQALHAGVYTAVITNVSGAVTSAPIALNVIPPVERGLVPGVTASGEAGSSLNLEYTDALGPSPAWLPLATLSLSSPPPFYFDLTAPMPPERFYRGSQIGTPGVIPSLGLHLIPALRLKGDVGHQVRVDGINQFGPTDAWFTLDTVTLTNPSQLYFDVSCVGQPARLYRLTPVP